MRSARAVGWNFTETSTSVANRTAPSGITRHPSRRTVATRPSANSRHTPPTANRAAWAHDAPTAPTAWIWYTLSVPPRTSGGSGLAKSSLTAWPLSRRIASIRSSVSSCRRRRAEPP